MGFDVSRTVADNARFVIAIMVVASVVVAAGVPIVERSSSLDQFQTDAEEADALEYVEENVSSGPAGTTTAQVLVRDENVLDRETLVATLEYERTLRRDATVNQTLVENDSMWSIANVVATAAIRGKKETAPPRRERQLDPSLDAQIAALRALNDSQVEHFVKASLGGTDERASQALALMPEHYEPGSTESNATLLVVTQQSPESSFAPGDAPEKIEDAQEAMIELAPDGDAMSTLIYGEGIVSREITESMIDSVLLVGPLAFAFVLAVLVVVYRDPFDILLGVAGVVLVLVWTFGAMGWVGIDFSQPFIVVLVLLVGLSIDYGLHVVMRYREARQAGETTPKQAMAAAVGSVGVALVYVTVTTVIGFLSNLTSPLGVFRELGLVSAIGIVATLLIFGLFVPAVKLEVDTALERRGFDRVKPAVGTGEGPINRVLATGVTLATTAPYLVLALALAISATGAVAATNVDASFEQTDFLAEEPADKLRALPEPVAPGTYTAKTAVETLDTEFVRQDTTASVLVRGDVTDPGTLEALDAARANASEHSAIETYADGKPAVTDPITVMDRVAAKDESVNATLADADTDGDGVPERNVTAVYDELMRVAPEEAGAVIHRTDGEYRALRTIVTVDSSADDATVHGELAALAASVDGDGVTAIATGDIVVNQITADQLAETARLSLVVALLSVLLVVAAAYRVTAGTATLGVVTIVPVVCTLTWVLGTMALLDIPFNIVTGMITGLTTGLGVDYSLHVSQRFVQEFDGPETITAALRETVTGTGGALLSSATTTASGFAVLLIAVLPFLQSFGLITALTIVFAFLASVFVLPSLLIIWATDGRSERSGEHAESTTTDGDN